MSLYRGEYMITISSRLAMFAGYELGIWHFTPAWAEVLRQAILLVCVPNYVCCGPALAMWGWSGGLPLATEWRSLVWNWFWLDVLLSHAVTLVRPGQSRAARARSISDLKCMTLSHCIPHCWPVGDSLKTSLLPVVEQNRSVISIKTGNMVIWKMQKHTQKYSSWTKNKLVNVGQEIKKKHMTFSKSEKKILL